MDINLQKEQFSYAHTLCESVRIEATKDLKTRLHLQEKECFLNYFD
jgi:hypothetical protein